VNDPPPATKSRNAVRKELGYTFIVALGSLTFGYVLGFNSPAHDTFKDEWKNVNDKELMWFNAITDLSSDSRVMVISVLFHLTARDGTNETRHVVCGA
jgi:hypothetical protein